MPRNGQGVYSPPVNTQAIANTTIESAKFNAVVDDIAQGITESLPRNGSAPMLADLPMGSKKITTLAAGTVDGDGVNKKQMDDAIAAFVDGGRLGKSAKIVANWDLIDATGFYRSGENTINGPTPSGNYLGRVVYFSNLWQTQEVYEFTTDGPADSKAWRREMNNGVWTAWYPILSTRDEMDARYVRFLVSTWLNSADGAGRILFQNLARTVFRAAGTAGYESGFHFEDGWTLRYAHLYKIEGTAGALQLRGATANECGGRLIFTTGDDAMMWDAMANKDKSSFVVRGASAGTGTFEAQWSVTNTGQLWTRGYGWLHDRFAQKSAQCQHDTTVIEFGAVRYAKDTTADVPAPYVMVGLRTVQGLDSIYIRGVILRNN